MYINIKISINIGKMDDELILNPPQTSSKSPYIGIWWLNRAK
jgi:hypothetical protein